jgi:UPF0271 protein
LKRVDLNVDLGEGFPDDARLLTIATSANVACGEHAGSWEATLATIALCRERGVRIGAHPGYPDRANLGRVHLDPADSRVADSLRNQILRFRAVCVPAYLKPHGAFYQAIAEGSEPAIALARELMELAETDRLMGMPGTGHERVGGRLIREGFADRRYLPDGRLAPRTLPGAMLIDSAEIAAQVRRLAPTVDSLCVHGDETRAVQTATLVRRTLEEKGYEVGW